MDYELNSENDEVLRDSENDSDADDDGWNQMREESPLRKRTC